MKINFEDLTFVIPIRLDSIARVENLFAVVNHIYSNCITQISVLETAPFNNGIIQHMLGNKIQYRFVKDLDPIFHRTKYRNRLTDEVKTPFLAVWDADVVAGMDQISESVEALRSGNYDISFPYDGRFLDTTSIIRSLYLEKGTPFEVLRNHQGRMNLLYGSQHKGGAFLANTLKYRSAGSENELFYGWGPEDFERYERWSNLRYRIHFAPGVLFHLSHSRDINGNFSSKLQRERSNSELRKTRLSSSGELYTCHNKSSM